MYTLNSTGDSSESRGSPGMMVYASGAHAPSLRATFLFRVVLQIQIISRGLTFMLTNVLIEIHSLLRCMYPSSRGRQL